MKPHFIYRHNHISTIVPALFRKIENPKYVREEIITEDNDFFHVDKLIHPDNTKAIILLHGLEGASTQHYIKASALKFFHHHYDVYAMNFRSCSGVMNKTTRLYHSGETQDLRFLVKKVLSLSKYQSLNFMGFSLGANVLLKYLGEESNRVAKEIKAAVAVSVPMDLKGCSFELAKGFSKVYSLHFMSTLRKKVEYIQRVHKHKELIQVDPKQLKTFLDFDELVTAPLHGFTGALDYWERSSSKPFLHKIHVSSLIINAKNDPFLSPSCFPHPLDVNNPHLQFQFPDIGGHVGFVAKKLNAPSYVELESLNFIESFN